ncbi:hypothetical protein NDU88_004314 [Pleurodeles waltl]|uniref:Uncharacterized protein n=1 Tax=Pleurodeles waltl TaxID=8319 RepID=A0AAV7KXC9_PLEWA|nr:hypothetical protein NDU88_004314 [Pleurodeles waltl]
MEALVTKMVEGQQKLEKAMELLLTAAEEDRTSIKTAITGQAERLDKQAQNQEKTRRKAVGLQQGDTGLTLSHFVAIHLMKTRKKKREDGQRAINIGRSDADGVQNGEKKEKPKMPGDKSKKEKLARQKKVKEELETKEGKSKDKKKKKEEQSEDEKRAIPGQEADSQSREEEEDEH